MMFSVRTLHGAVAASVIAATALIAAPAIGATQSASPIVLPTRSIQSPDLDLSIQYYSRVLTPEGVLRESRYEEKMLRRPGHVWVARVLPKAVDTAHDEHQNAARERKNSGDFKPASVSQSGAGRETNEHAHKDFNHIVLPRHVFGDENKIRVEFVDAHDKAIVFISPTEYENVNFDGSWANAYYLIDPKGIASLPLSGKTSPIAGAQWREREKDGIFQRVLWDGRKMIPLIVETGDRAGTFFRRIEVKPLASLSRELPWQNLKGYAQKEYSDFLD